MSTPDTPEPITYSPIGYVHCEQSYRSEAPRQAVFADNAGQINLIPGHDFETALRDLEQFSHIWVIYDLHLNKKWKPIVAPPVTANQKRFGVFATRSPHRPCSIGMSCVKLEKIENLAIFIKDFDMLDGTPVLDIKPYIVDSDSIPDASRGWLPERGNQYEICFEENTEIAMSWIVERGGPDLKNFCLTQLVVNPTDSKRKRVKMMDSSHGTIHCRTWKIAFEVDLEKSFIKVYRVDSNYQLEELADGADDRYNDKDLHRDYTREISQ